MDRVTISIENINKLLGVVASLPYSQVAQVLQEVQQDIKPVEEVNEEKE